MDQADRVSFGERSAGRSDRIRAHAPGGLRSVDSDKPLERRAVEELHRVVEDAVVGAPVVEDGDGVRMGEPCGELHFAGEALQRALADLLFSEELDGGRSPEEGMAGPINHAHPAFAQPARGRTARTPRFAHALPQPVDDPRGERGHDHLQQPPDSDVQRDAQVADPAFANFDEGRIAMSQRRHEHTWRRAERREYQRAQGRAGDEHRAKNADGHGGERRHQLGAHARRYGQEEETEEPRHDQDERRVENLQGTATSLRVYRPRSAATSRTAFAAWWDLVARLRDELLHRDAVGGDLNDEHEQRDAELIAQTHVAKRVSRSCRPPGPLSVTENALVAEGFPVSGSPR